MGNITQSILNSIDILLQKRVSSLQFNKTVRATVVSADNQALNKYTVQYQDAKFDAFASDSNTTYNQGDQVYVVIPNDDYKTNKMIIGTVKQLGSKYLAATTSQGSMTKIGSNIIKSSNTIELCTYNTDEQNIKSFNVSNISQDDLDQYKKDHQYILIGATIQTNIPNQQQTNAGNYGIIIEAEYYSKQYLEGSQARQKNLITKTYVLDVSSFTGQPYKYILPTRQYSIFAIDGNNLKDIKSITAFCKGFPITQNGHNNDIFISSLQMYFLQPLTEEQINGQSLKILTPNGSYLTSFNDDTKTLKAQVKIRGKVVSSGTTDIKYYWFVKDSSVTSNNGLYYQFYGGQGWRCINPNFQKSTDSEGNLVMYFQPAADTLNIDPDASYMSVQCNTFKCVGVYDKIILSDTIKIYNKASVNKTTLTSSSGTKFYFDTGKTTLTCNFTSTVGYSNFTFIWGYRTAESESLQVIKTDEKTFTSQTYSAASALEDESMRLVSSSIIYECTVLSNGNKVGEAEITLVNTESQKEYKVVIRNGAQVFKYDENGASPAGKDAAPADRLTVLPLSFDIYNDQHRIVTPSDDEITSMCDIKWVLPDKQQTMLIFEDYPEDYNDTVINSTTNEQIKRHVIKGEPTLSFTIRDNYNLSKFDNDIKLQVLFQGHSLVANTNFTFVKQGGLGTNGTEYIARILPYSSEDSYKVYIQDGKFVSYNEASTTSYNNLESKYNITESYDFRQLTGATLGVVPPLRVELRNSTGTIVYDSKNKTDNGTTYWGLIDIGGLTKHCLKAVDNTSGNFTYTEQDPCNTTIQAKISSRYLAETARNYFAAYPIMVSKTSDKAVNYHAIVTGGYDTCMFNSDGTRGKFASQPFVFKVFSGQDRVSINDNDIQWYVSWSGKTITGNSVQIIPPSYYDSQNINNYITVTAKDNSGRTYTVVISVYFYLNRYGMSAMNDWDGTAIKIDNDNNYILAPQIGAGEKDQYNRFTGITMGKQFNSDYSTSQIGLMGYSSGARSIFLNAKDGSATFGVSGSGQIIIEPGSRAQIRSGNYVRGSSGMLIDFQTPQIRFGSGNFSVTKQGYLTAKGGGSVGGWKISDDSLKSSSITLFSSADNTYFDVNNRFHVNADGSFRAANSKFSVDKDGVIKSTAGTIGGWSIGEKTLSSSNISFTSGSNASIDVSKGSFHVDNQGNVRIRYGSIKLGGDENKPVFSVDNKGYLTATSGKIGGWTIGTNTLSSSNITFTSGSNASIEVSNNSFHVSNDGSMTAKKGTIGGWTIGSSSLASTNNRTILNNSGDAKFGNLNIYNNGKIENVNRWSIDENGVASFSNTATFKNTASFTSALQLAGALRGTVGSGTLTFNGGGLSGTNGRAWTLGAGAFNAIGYDNLKIGNKAINLVVDELVANKITANYISGLISEIKFLTINGTLSTSSRADINLASAHSVWLDAGSLSITGAKSGKAVFSDDSYLQFKNGLLTGGKTASGGSI